jgi:hypothetical protein
LVEIRQILAITILVFFISLSILGVTGEGFPSAQSILRTMAVRYAKATSYQDVGRVETKYFRSGVNNEETILFKTYFIRPRFFRVEWSSAGAHSFKERNAVVCDNNRTVVYSSRDKFETMDDLSLGIAYATGISSGAAHTISSLLIENTSDFRILDLANIVVTGTDVFEGIECFVITGRHPLGDKFELWVGRNDYLLRKLRTEHRFDTFSTVTMEVRQEIKINGAIPLDVFHLTRQ